MHLIGMLFALTQVVAEPSREASGATAEARRSHGQCVAILVTSPQVPDGRPRARFSATRILDLRIASRLRRHLPGEHALQFKVYTPRGHLYQTLTTPLTGEGRLNEVSAILPVGGTAIMSNSLYGRWRVEAFLDGDTKPCAAAAAFEIQP